MNKYTLVVEKNENGFWGQVQEYPGVFTHGETISEIKRNAKEALELYFVDDELSDLKNVEFEILVDVRDFFEINDYINISKLAKRTGMNTSLLRQYAKGLKYPSLKQVSRIEKTINEIGTELLNTNLVGRPIQTN